MTLDPVATDRTEQRLQTFVDSIPALAWMANADGWITWYNRRWYEYTGTTPRQMEGWGWQTVHDPAILPSVMDRWTASIRTGEPFEMVFPLLGADSQFRSFLTRVVPIRDDHGIVTQWFGTNAEIDELQRTREALEISEARHRSIADDLRDANRVMQLTEAVTQSGFWQFWPRQDRLVMSTGSRRLFYLPEHTTQATEDSLDDLLAAIHPEDRHLVAAAMAGAELSGELSVSFRVGSPATHTGQPSLTDTRWISSRATVLYEDDGEPHMLGVNVDITSQKLFEDKLLKSEKLAAVGRLAATISHELNNPLESVTNLLFLMQQHETPDTDVREYAHIAAQELARVSHIVTHTLRFHRQATHSTQELLAPLVDSAIALHQGKINSCAVSLTRDFSSERALRCFAGELRQVFANFIGNAIDATPHHGVIRIAVKDTINFARNQRGVRVVIADSGHGMDQDTITKLFEPFFSTKGENGTGLGLWLSQQIVSKHGGTIRLRSCTSGARRGTTFAVFFPFDIVPPSSATGALDLT